MINIYCLHFFTRFTNKMDCHYFMTFLSLINLLWYSLKKQLGLQLYKKKKTLLQVFSIKISQTFIHAPEKNIAALWKSLVFSVTSSFFKRIYFSWNHYFHGSDWFTATKQQQQMLSLKKNFDDQSNYLKTKSQSKIIF